MNIPFELFFIIFSSYLIGSLPTAVIISKVFFGFDIRNEGSGNMGSTNAFRVLGWKWGVVVQLIDISKGIIVVIFIANHFGEDLVGKLSWISDIKILQIIAGISAVAGHIWSLFVNFRGGKGVNTAAGMLLGLAPVDFGVAFVLFTIAVVLSGYISLGSIVAAVSIPTSLLFRTSVLGESIPGYHTMLYFAFAIMLLVIYTHRSNIKRLLQGNENKFQKLHLIKLRKSK
jgi:glycerol-3-phosphate acyltransferase PlsY